MAPTPYRRTFSFTGSVSANPNFVPAAFGVGVDAELDQVGATLGAVEASLGLIQRADGALANGIVTLDSMATGLLATFQGYVAASAASASQAAASNSSAAGFASTASSAAASAASAAISATNAALTSGANATQTGKDVVSTGQNVAAAQSAQAGASVASAVAGMARDQAVAANIVTQAAELQAQQYASQIAASVSTAAGQANQATTAAQSATASATAAAQGASVAVAARQSAVAWATQASGLVSDGVNPAGYSAYYWAQQAQSNATATMIPNGSVTTAKLANGAVTAAILASGAAVQNIGNGSLTAAMLASGVALSNIGSAGITSTYLAVGTALANLVDGTVPASKLTNASVGTQQIANAAITAALLAAGAVTALALGPKAVGTAAIADGAVTDTQIAGVNAAKVTYTSALGGNARSVVARFDDMLSVGMFSSFAAAVAACPGRRLWVPRGNWQVTANLSVPNDLIFDTGAVIAVAANVTMAFNGAIDAPKSQIFSFASSTSCNIFMAGCSEIYPEWWGATAYPTIQAAAAAGSGGDGSAYAQLLYAFNTANITGGLTVKLSGYYRLNNQISLSGNVRIRGTGRRSSGFCCTGTGGLLKYIGSYDANNVPTIFDVADFACAALDPSSGGVNRGAAITATWPAVSTTWPTLIAKNIEIRSQTANSAEGSAGYFSYGFYLKQATACLIEDFYMPHFGNATAVGVRMDNDTRSVANGGQGCYLGKIVRMNMQGGNVGIWQTGWNEQFLVDEPALDTQQTNIIFDATNSGIPGGINGVLAIRGGDYNANVQCINLVNWRWATIEKCNLSTFSNADSGTTTNADTVFINGGSHLKFTDNYVDANTQASGACLVRVRNHSKWTYRGNTHGNCVNGLIYDQGNTIPGGNISDNIFEPNGGTACNRAILISAGSQHVIHHNSVYAFNVAIEVDVGNNQIDNNYQHNCATPYIIASGNVASNNN